MRALLTLSLAACAPEANPPELPPLELQCAASDLPTETGIVGLSDPHAIEPGVIDLSKRAGPPGFVRSSIGASSNPIPTVQ